MLRLRLMRSVPKIDFVGQRYLWFAVTGLIMLATVISLSVQGLNLGIDFRGGTLIEVRTPGAVDLGAVRTRLNGLGLGEVQIQEFGAPNDLMIRLAQQDGGEAAQLAAVAQIKQALGPGYEYRRTEVVGPNVSAELLRNALIAAGLSVIAIAAYVWFRFEWQFGVSALVATFHDVFATFGLFSLLGFEFNMAAVAAILTIAGYSINDTVVVFDRIRENMRKYKKMPFPDLFNLSINETLSRTIITGGTTMLAILALVVAGGPVIRGFAIAMAWGIVIGTFSSIYVASSLLLYLKPLRRPEGTESAPDLTRAA